MKHTLLSEKIKEKIGYTPTQQEIANILGVRQSVISSRATRGNDYKLEEILKLQSHYAINLLGDLNENSLSSKDIELDFYPNIFGSCGCGASVFDESKEKMQISKTTIPNYSDNNSYFVITAKGSSMAPLLFDDDKVIIQKWNGEQIIDDRIYLFRYKGELFIKRLVKNIDEIIAISENKDFSNRPLKDVEDFEIIGQIVGLIREMR